MKTVTNKEAADMLRADNMKLKAILRKAKVDKDFEIKKYKQMVYVLLSLLLTVSLKLYTLL